VWSKAASGHQEGSQEASFHALAFASALAAAGLGRLLLTAAVS
jgi:hypothetical protein